MRRKTLVRERKRYKKYGDEDSGEAGMVTGELAWGMLSIAFLLVLLFGLMHGGIQYAQAYQAARSAARVAALGEGEEKIITAAQAVMPGASVRMRQSGDILWIRVNAHREGVAARLGIDVVAESSSIIEPAEIGRKHRKN